MKKTATILMAMIMIFTAARVFAQGHSDIIEISTASGMQGWAQACYDYNSDEYLVVWEDYRGGSGSDIYGQFVDGDGSLIGENFAICASEGDQYWPRLDFDPGNNRYLPRRQRSTP